MRQLLKEQRPDKIDPKGQGTVILMLGLYLIVLAFFILLNAISDLAEDRFEKASESITSGFGFRNVAMEKQESDDDTSITQIYDAVARELRGVLESYMSLRDFRFEANNDQMIVRLKPENFYEKGDWRLNAGQVSFFEELAEVVHRQRVGTQMHVDIRVNAASNQTLPDKLGPLELAAMRASLFTRALLERGVSDQQVTSGAFELEVPEITLFFYVIVHNEQQAIRAFQSKKAGGR